MADENISAGNRDRYRVVDRNVFFLVTACDEESFLWREEVSKLLIVGLWVHGQEVRTAIDVLW